ncbi:MAG TPA: sigma-70 family RNA polymerase sigma factor [Steroidobacteraceae bacterium]|nr:sigma-70 family RNA polymerase sigma factor [Steroidobacteraceae bacterium]
MRNTPPGTPVSFLDGARQARDDTAASRLFTALRPELLRFACWLTRDRSLAEDVVQEALLRAWRSRDALEDAAAARGWLFTIVRREHARLYERKRLEMTNLHDAIASEDTELAQAGDADLADLRLAILRLPDDYRIPLVMQVMGGFTTTEIASELELSPGAVLTRLFRARNKLRTICGLPGAPDVPDESLP